MREKSGSWKQRRFSPSPVASDILPRRGRNSRLPAVPTCYGFAEPKGLGPRSPISAALTPLPKTSSAKKITILKKSVDKSLFFWYIN